MFVSSFVIFNCCLFRFVACSVASYGYESHVELVVWFRTDVVHCLNFIFYFNIFLYFLFFMYGCFDFFVLIIACGV